MPEALTWIDTAFDVRSDAGTGDPDTTSPTLRRYHQLLWSKRLPNGRDFTLSTSRRRTYLHHASELGEFFLSSDTVVPTFRSYVKYAHIISKIPEAELDEFQVANHTVGGMMVFPGEKRPGSLTVNGARGLNSHIADRFDLTMECIRRFYLGEPSPLFKTLTVYRDFFDLFGSFRGYVEFFLLEDLVTDGGAVKLFSPFEDFSTPALPGDVDAYRAYRDAAVAFIAARNRRIDLWARSNLSGIPVG